ncbi:Bardet-Biedl syndrome 7 protein homolog isoform X2 [Galleria mellonella]|uniref:Bardet-Biedl syndrome 7 protein homolog isoform X2 n=2 Tax=Galleria mellonella TaxID=7137 RepID=A0ABM3MK32_GALME|nr:Bardet-Biedl syndrome 7 protein homolog isoform X2 [Galleria mellonella]
MDYDLSRIDYTICGITFPDTLKILPIPVGPKIQQKFTIGDKNGVLQCLSIKDEEPVVQFKTLPGKPITSVQLASSTGTLTDKIFAASGNEVKGYTRKGKVFLTIETPLTETITSMCVLGVDLILCSGRTVTCYRDLREIHSYICDDRVLDIAAYNTPNNTRMRLLVLVANKGAEILENGYSLAHTAISAGPTRLAVPPSLHALDVYAFYGAADGSLGLIIYEGSTLTSKCLMEGRGLGSVVCLGWFMGNGGTHLAVGRHDGSIQLYLIDMENMSGKPRLKFTYFCGEPVTSVCGGCVGTDDHELLAATFSGRIFGLRSQRLVPGVANLTNIPQDALASRRAKLESEVIRLEKQTANEREKYQRNTRSLHGGLSAPPLLDIQYELQGATRDGWQEAKITSAVPLDMLFIYCKRKLDLLTDNAAVLSICSSQSGAKDLLATVRCQAGTRRLWVRMRYILQANDPVSRAESVQVLIYALPSAAPRVARLITLRLPVLPYYSQHENMDKENEKRSWCQVHITGSFSVAEMTSWLTDALPGDLPRPSANVAFARSHTLLRTLLVCRYQRGMGIFISDNVTTIAIIKDIISNCSVKKNIRIEISTDIPDNCCVQSFQGIKEQFETEYRTYKDNLLKKAISALELDERATSEEAPTICNEYQRVWSISDDTLTDTHFEELVDTIDEWYVDFRSLTLRNTDYTTERVKLRKALKDCELEQILLILANENVMPHDID